MTQSSVFRYPGDFSSVTCSLTSSDPWWQWWFRWFSRSVVSDSLQPHGLYVAHQAPLSMEFSRQESWSGLPFRSPGDPGGIPNPGILNLSLLHWQAGSLLTEPPGKPPLWSLEVWKTHEGGSFKSKSLRFLEVDA